MAKDKDIVSVPEQEFTLMADNAELIDLSVAMQQLGWTAQKVKTSDLVGQVIIIKDYKKVINRDDEAQWYYYCACTTADGSHDYCTIIGGSQIKEYLERAWDYNPRARVSFRLGLTQTARGNSVYFIDAP